MREVLKKKGVVVGDLINGTGALIVSVIVVLVIISTLLGADLLKSTGVQNVYNESTGDLNSSNPYRLSVYNINNHDFAIVRITYLNSSITIPSSNYTFYSANASLIAITTNYTTGGAGNGANITYTYKPATKYEDATNNLSSDFGKGIGNVSTKIPTILLIAAVVLLFGVIVLLVRMTQNTGFGIKQGSSGGGL